MNLFTGDSADAYFGGDVPATVRELLHEAVTVPPRERTALLWTAQAIAPDCLAVYYTLYKHHTRQREYDLAERAARRGLAQAARQAGLDLRGEPLLPGTRVDFFSDGPARFWLFTLKALAFICLRSGRPGVARDLLTRIEQLEPQARLGDDVIAALLRATGPGTAGERGD